ncbi:hypothetical protein BH18THE2_BH18THE2_19180 [soil metagenome]
MIVVWLGLLVKRFLVAKFLMSILESIFSRSRMYTSVIGIWLLKSKMGAYMLTKRLESSRGKNMGNRSCNTTVSVG